MYCFGLFCEQPARVSVSGLQTHQREGVAAGRSRETLLITCRNVRLLTVSNHVLPTSIPHVSLSSFLAEAPLLESVFLWGEVYVLLVPFAWGQALFSVEVLRVYPNVQDLGVSARLSESGGTQENTHLIRKCHHGTVIKENTDIMNDHLIQYSTPHFYIKNSHDS